MIFAFWFFDLPCIFENLKLNSRPLKALKIDFFSCTIKLSMTETMGNHLTCFQFPKLVFFEPPYWAYHTFKSLVWQHLVKSNISTTNMHWTAPCVHELFNKYPMQMYCGAMVIRAPSPLPVMPLYSVPNSPVSFLFCHAIWSSLLADCHALCAARPGLQCLPLWYSIRDPGTFCCHCGETGHLMIVAQYIVE